MTKGPNVKLCPAKSKTTGEQCKQPVVPGCPTCHYHGSGAPQVKAAGQRRLLALVDPAISAIQRAMEDDDPKVRASAVKAAEAVLNRTGLEAVSKQDIHAETKVVMDEETAVKMLLGLNNDDSTS